MCAEEEEIWGWTSRNFLRNDLNGYKLRRCGEAKEVGNELLHSGQNMTLGGPKECYQFYPNFIKQPSNYASPSSENHISNDSKCTNTCKHP